MKKTLFFLCLLLMLAHAALAQTSTPFITHWRGGTAINLQVEGAVDYTLYDSSTNAVVRATTNYTTGTISIGSLSATTTYNLHIRYNKTASSRQFYSSSTTHLTYLRGVSQWGDTEWTSMAYAFYYASNLTTLPADTPTTYLVTDYSFMFINARAFNGDLSSWNVSQGANFAYMFYNASAFNQDLSRWDVSKGTNFYSMFSNAIAFNGDLSSWDVSQGTNFSYMFYGATAFNRDLASWDVSQGINFAYMFYNARAFNQDLSSWDVSKGTNFSYMFINARAFNQDLSSWDVSKGTNFYSMFSNAIAFNQDLSRWDVSKGTNFAYMFSGTTVFNQDLSRWNVSKGTNFAYMFYNATVFNGDLGSWDVSKGTNFGGMFYNATAFNQDLSSWDVSNGTNFSSMFNGATTFNQDLRDWELSSVVPAGLAGMFTGAGIDCANLSTSLIGWASNPNTASGVTLDLTGRFYNASAAAAIATLSAAPYNWVITTGTVVPDADCLPTPLPISLLSFGAAKNGSTAVVLDWEIIEDEEVKMYVIERSTPHSEWQQLTTLAPSADKAPTKIYSYTDAQPAKGVNLYRLKITDVFGKTTYSKVANVVFASESEVSIYPNPATTQITIASPSVAISTINVFNAQGQKVYSIAVDGVMEHQIDLSPLASGVYFLHVTCADGSTSNEKVIKQ